MDAAEAEGDWLGCESGTGKTAWKETFALSQEDERVLGVWLGADMDAGW